MLPLLDKRIKELVNEGFNTFITCKLFQRKGNKENFVSQHKTLITKICIKLFTNIISSMVILKICNLKVKHSIT